MKTARIKTCCTQAQDTHLTLQPTKGECSFHNPSDELFFMRESSPCYVAEQLLFETEWELFVPVLRYVAWIMRVNYLSVQGLHSSRGQKGTSVNCASSEFLHRAPCERKYRESGKRRVMLYFLLPSQKWSVCNQNQPEPSRRRPLEAIQKLFAENLDIDGINAAQLHEKQSLGQGIRLLQAQIFLSSQRKSLQDPNVDAGVTT